MAPSGRRADMIQSASAATSVATVARPVVGAASAATTTTPSNTLLSPLGMGSTALQVVSSRDRRVSWSPFVVVQLRNKTDGTPTSRNKQGTRTFQIVITRRGHPDVVCGKCA